MSDVEDDFVRVELPQPDHPPPEEQPAAEQKPQESVPPARARSSSTSSGSSTSSSEKEEPAQEQLSEPAAQEAEPEGTRHYPCWLGEEIIHATRCSAQLRFDLHVAA